MPGSPRLVVPFYPVCGPVPRSAAFRRLVSWTNRNRKRAEAESSNRQRNVVILVADRIGRGREWKGRETERTRIDECKSSDAHDLGFDIDIAVVLIVTANGAGRGDILVREGGQRITDATANRINNRVVVDEIHSLN